METFAFQKRRIGELVSALSDHAYRYHVLDDPCVSDEEYDALYRELKELEAETGHILPDSPTQRIGGSPLSQFPPAPHREQMLSLANAFSEEDVAEFVARVRKVLGDSQSFTMTVEPKYDGLAVELSYRSGIFIRGATRGDGFVGEDITQNLRSIKSIPLRIEAVSKAPEWIDVRGEVFLTREELSRINQQKEARGEKSFANTRNAAAGSLRQLDPSVTAGRRLHLAVYGVGAVQGAEFLTYIEMTEWLKGARFPMPEPPVLVHNVKEAIEAIKGIEARRASYPYDLDGAVIKVNELPLRELLGNRTREPRWAVAYKFAAQKAATVVRGIEASVGRLGTITPVAILEPVEVAGVTISRATLHNWGEVARKDIRVGDAVEVERAGEVIPAVVRVIHENRPPDTVRLNPPTECPVCGGAVVQDEEEAALRCGNINCRGQAVARIVHYGSRNALNIEGLGERVVEQLVTSGLVKCFTDLYSLGLYRLLQLPRFGEKSAQNLLDAIEKSKSADLDRFLFALGIPYVGETAARLIASNFKRLEDLYDIETHRLCLIDQIGEKTAQSVAEFFSNAMNIEALNQLLAVGMTFRNRDYFDGAQSPYAPLAGKTLVITGTMEFPRSQVQQMIEQGGGRVAGAVSRKVDYLVAGEQAGSKLQKARELGVKTISFQELQRLLGAPSF